MSITSLTVKPGITYPFKVGETAFLQYKIANYGNTTAYNTTTQVKFNGTLVGTINVGNILGGNEHTLEISLNGVPEGTHNIELIAVPSNPSLESNNTNNSKIGTFIWKGIPDLVLTYLNSVNGSQFEASQPVEFLFTVENLGTGKANGTITNYIEVNGTEIASFSFSDLDVGYMATIRFKLTFTEGGTYNVKAHVNKYNTIIESNTSNNSQTKTITIIRKLLAVPEYCQLPYDQICWATRASMIISFFNDDTIDRAVQIAKDKWGTTNFNQGATIYDSRDAVTKYAGKVGNITNDALSYTAVQYQINNDCPIGVRIEWKSGGAHAMVIKGYDISYSSVIYNDPWDGLGHSASYEFFKSNDDYSWTGSLFYK